MNVSDVLELEIDDLGPLLARAWELKKQVAPASTNEQVDSLYDRGLAHGATGGKLLGAGGSGYLAFYVPADAQQEFAHHMPEKLAFSISQLGAGIIHDS